jgi:hypothetical protein
MTAFNSLLKHLAIRRSILPDRLYWVVFALMVLCAAGLEAFWIYALQIPFVFPDSHSYVDPIVNHWLLPFSQARTSGTSMFIAAALAIFRHPAGILILNGILAIGSAALLSISIKSVLKQNVMALLVLFLVMFTAKNITFGYVLLSEHYARVLYVIYAALMLWLFQNPKRIGIAALAGISVVLNILVKPSAIVLLVATPIACIAVAWTSRTRRRQIIATTAVFLATITIPLAGYMLAFQTRYGTFSLSHFEGYNLFSHVGHLTVLNGGNHPALKERLKPLLGPYAANYAAKGNYQPNWLAYGSADEQLRRDFGDKSPARAVRDYVLERYPSGDVRWINAVYLELATESMLAHPISYLKYAANRSYALWRLGYSFDYYYVLPATAFLEQHRQARQIQRKWFYQLYGETVPLCEAGPVVPSRAAGPLAALFRGPIASCIALPYENPAIVKAAEWADLFYRKLTNIIRDNFWYLPRIGAVAAVLAGIILLSVRGRRVLNVYAFGLLLSLVLLGYTMLHGLLNVAEAQRMTANVQDYLVVASCAFIFCAALSSQRLLLYAIALGRKGN